MKFADTNVFLFALDRTAAESGAARRALEQGEGISFNAIVASEFLHILSRARGRREARRRLEDLVTTYRLLPVDPQTLRRSGEIHESFGLSANDSILAAQALGLEMELLSFDGDFRRVKGLRFEHLRA
ncbi:MAG: PIN domain-containing protein [Halobacteria archaeon]